jgi:hypothetical protein
MRRLARSAYCVVAAALIACAGANSATGQDYRRSDYIDMTEGKKLPKPTSAGPLAAVIRYLDGIAGLDRARIALHALADRDGFRAYRVEIVCRSAEECADDSVAATREAVEVRRGSNGSWAVVWVGLQVKCHKGRGSQEWSKERCS